MTGSASEPRKPFFAAMHELASGTSRRDRSRQLGWYSGRAVIGSNRSILILISSRAWRARRSGN